MSSDPWSSCAGRDQTGRMDAHVVMRHADRCDGSEGRDGDAIMSLSSIRVRATVTVFPPLFDIGDEFASDGEQCSSQVVAEGEPAKYQRPSAKVV